jgi:hypothetical protein
MSVDGTGTAAIVVPPAHVLHVAQAAVVVPGVFGIASELPHVLQVLHAVAAPALPAGAFAVSPILTSPLFAVQAPVAHDGVE